MTGSQTFPHLTEKEHVLLSLTKKLGWLESEATFFQTIGHEDTAADFEERAETVRLQIKAVAASSGIFKVEVK